MGYKILLVGMTISIQGLATGTVNMQLTTKVNATYLQFVQQFYTNGHCSLD